jgi:DNA-binding transcriptional LysR family regulator
MRLAFGDELFVLGESGMEPTARAVELAPGIRKGLVHIAEVLVAKEFVPAESSRTFRIAASDYGSTIVLSPLIKLLQSEAPQIEIRVFPYSRMDAIKSLDEGRVDIVLGWFSEISDRLQRKTILVDEEAVVVRKDHPLTKTSATLENLLSFPFAVVEMTGSEERGQEGFIYDRGVWRRTWIDRVLIETKAEDKDVVGSVAVTLPYYAAIPDMVSNTDIIATLPKRLALRAVEQQSIAMLALPYEPLVVQFEALWHSRANDDQGISWILQKMIEVTSGE